MEEGWPFSPDLHLSEAWCWGGRGLSPLPLASSPDGAVAWTPHLMLRKRTHPRRHCFLTAFARCSLKQGSRFSPTRTEHLQCATPLAVGLWTIQHGQIFCFYCTNQDKNARAYLPQDLSLSRIQITRPKPQVSNTSSNMEKALFFSSVAVTAMGSNVPRTSISR